MSVFGATQLTGLGQQIQGPVLPPGQAFAEAMTRSGASPHSVMTAGPQASWATPAGAAGLSNPATAALFAAMLAGSAFGGKIKNKGARKAVGVGTGTAGGALAGSSFGPVGTGVGAGLGALMSIFA